MSYERSDRAWDAYQQAAGRLDYFMVGLLAALTGYLGQQIHPLPLGLNGSTVELAAIVLFGLSMFHGIRRLEWFVQATGAMYGRLRKSDSTEQLIEAAKEAPANLNVRTGEVETAGHLIARAAEMVGKGEAMSGEIGRVTKRAESAYAWRNRLFYAGIVLLVAARVVEAYGH